MEAPSVARRVVGVTRRLASEPKRLGPQELLARMLNGESVNDTNIRCIALLVVEAHQSMDGLTRDQQCGHTCTSGALYICTRFVTQCKCECTVEFRLASSSLACYKVTTAWRGGENVMQDSLLLGTQLDVICPRRFGSLPALAFGFVP